MSRWLTNGKRGFKERAQEKATPTDQNEELIASTCSDIVLKKERHNGFFGPGWVVTLRP